MKVVPLEGTTLTVPELVEMARGETVILTREGRPLVAVNDVSDPDPGPSTLARDPRFLAIVERSRRSYRERGGIGIDQLRVELGPEDDEDRAAAEAGSTDAPREPE